MQELKLNESLNILSSVADDTTNEGWTNRLRIHDPCIRAYALAQLLSSHTAIPAQVANLALHVAPRSAYLRRQFARTAQRLGRHEWVDRMIALQRKESPADTVLLEAIRREDAAGQAEAYRQLFLAQGDIDHLRAAAEVTRHGLGWRAAFPYYLRLLFIEPPPHGARILEMLQVLERESAEDAFTKVGKAASGLEGCEVVQAYWQARRYTFDGDWQAAIDYMDRVGVLRVEQPTRRLFQTLYARAYDKTGAYRRAAEFYALQNEAVSQSHLSATGYIEQLEARRELPIPELEPDTRSDYFIMAGFPRSGTTLLENAMAAHPQVSTAEETSALTRTFDVAFEGVNRQPDAASTEALRRAAHNHRERYYQILHHELDQNAAVKIDKTPILSSDIGYMEKLFPQKRYIFSIRHPYDVVLSNFKQSYRQNRAMAAFNRMDTACDLYDYVMRRWFTTFPDETERVCYVRYEALVNHFEPTVHRVIEFLGVDWHEDVLNFTEHSKKRAVRTPSYANVRKGLTLGVQTSYENYLFLFDDYCRRKLDPWVEFFGYTVEEFDKP